MMVIALLFVRACMHYIPLSIWRHDNITGTFFNLYHDHSLFWASSVNLELYMRR